MRLRDTGILLAVLVVLIGVWVVTQNPFGGSSAPARKDVELYRVPNDSITEIRLTRQGRPMVLRKTGEDQWTMTLDQTTLPGDSARISSSSLALGAIVAEGVVTQQSDNLAQFGLENPRITIEVVGSRTGSARIGGTNPVTRQDYAQVPGNPAVYNINSSWGQVVDQLFNDPPFPRPTPTPSPSPTPTATPIR